MAENNELARAKKVYEDLCAAFDKRSWHYQSYDDDLVVTCGFSGDDIPMSLLLIIDPERQLLRVLSKLPFIVPEDKRMDLAVAACVATCGLADGSFDFNITEGTIEFRLTASFKESLIGDGLFEYLIDCSVSTIDMYNDKFLALCKGLMSLDAFISHE